METAACVLDDVLTPYPALQDLCRVLMEIFIGELKAKAIDGQSAPRRNTDLQCIYAVVHKGAGEIEHLMWLRDSHRMDQKIVLLQIEEFADSITKLLKLPPHAPVPEPNDDLPNFIVAVAKALNPVGGCSYFLYRHPSIEEDAAPFWMEYVLRVYRSLDDIALNKPTGKLKRDEITAVSGPKAKHKSSRED